MANPPTLVFIHGSWHLAETWDKITSRLEEHYKCVKVTLPSSLCDPSATLGDDVEAVRAAITAETSQGLNVVVVVHSFGGHVGSSAIKGLTKPRDAPPDSKSGYVIGEIMMATGFTMTGVAFLDVFGDNPPDIWVCDYDAGFITLAKDPRELFYHDLPEEEGEAWVAKLTKQALKPLSGGGELVYSGWKDLPVWFLATQEDKALPVELQRMAVQMARDMGGDVTLREIATSHSPMLSKPQETAEFVMDAVKAFTA